MDWFVDVIGDDLGRGRVISMTFICTMSVAGALVKI